MKNKKGFTLIELLAVIVILAIIALIAVPVVMNIIESANKSAFKDSAYGIIKAGELYYTNELLKTGVMTEDRVFIFPNDITGLEINGSVPTGGSIVVNKKGQISMAIMNGKYCVTKGFEDEDITITDDATNCKNPPLFTLTYLATTKEFATNGETKTITPPLCVKNKTKCDLGTPIAIKVNNTQTYKFYVINDDIENNKVTLIMDRNLGEVTAWVTKVDYDDDTNWGPAGSTNKGPITALNYLNKQTETWNNIPAIGTYNYNNHEDGNIYQAGYQKLEIMNGVEKTISKDGVIETLINGESKARLLTYKEYDTIKKNNPNQDLSWMYENLSESRPLGYYLLAAYPNNSSRCRVINYDGTFDNAGLSQVLNYGIRPVIELSK